MDLIYNFQLHDSFYFGEKENETREGYGSIIFPSGNMYKGLWKNDMMDGYGKYIELNVGIFEGTFSKNKKHGSGCFYYFDKSFYNGCYVNDCKDGYGVYFKNNYLHYSGNWKKDMFHGVGKLYNNNGLIQYSGNFKRNKRHGKGKLYNQNGKLILEGEWKYDKFIYPPTEEYQSFYRNGLLKYKGEVNLKKKYHGYGSLFNNDGTILYKGQFVNGKKCGFGSFYHNNEILYDGNWKNNKFNGFGVLYRSNISPIVLLYKGEFKNGKCHGFGRQFFRNGNVIFEGIFENSEIKKGKKYDATGKLLYHGNFVNLLYHGNGILYESDKTIKGTFIKGEYFDYRGYLIRNFIETRNTTYLKKVTKDNLCEYSKCVFSKNISKFKTKQKIILELIENYQISCKTTPPTDNDDVDKYDLFGNEIKIPCLGSDNEIYDLSSMEYLFQMDYSGKYKNISYINLVPNFPVMKNGLVLSFYKILS